MSNEARSTQTLVGAYRARAQQGLDDVSITIYPAGLSLNHFTEFRERRGAGQSGQLDDLVKDGEHLGEAGIRDMFHRVRRAATLAPVE